MTNIDLGTLTMALISTQSEPSGDIKEEKAILAGGCFWCMEKPFKSLDGVLSVVSGYTGGEMENPTYDEVCMGDSGHLEAIEVIYDASKVSFEDILDVYWRQIDPTDANGQFVDRGSQYVSAIFVQDENQRKLAEKSKEKLAESGRFSKPIVTKILPASTFYPAESYHQDYYKKNSTRYELYHSRSGRESFLKRTWDHYYETKE